MAKNLVIVESPAKAKTLGKYLGRNYTVKASVGHVMDLPKSKLGRRHRERLQARLRRHPRQERRSSTSSRRRRRTRRTSTWRPTPIARARPSPGTSRSSSGTKKNIQRVLFNEITKKAVQEAIKHPLKLDRANVRRAAGAPHPRPAGRLPDLSPLLWNKVRRGLSAGRVQSVAVRLIVEREREIRAFVKEEYWTVEAAARGREAAAVRRPPLRGRRASGSITRRSGSRTRRRRARVVDEPRGRRLDGREGREEGAQAQSRRRRSSPRACSRRRRASSASSRAHDGLAQRLYEGVELGDEGPVGLITYMRTDSTRSRPTRSRRCAATSASSYGEEYLPEKPTVYQVEEERAGRPRGDPPDRRSSTRPSGSRRSSSKDELDALHADLEPLRRLPDGAGGLDADDRRHRGQGRRRSAPPARSSKFDGFIRVYTEGATTSTPSDDEDGERHACPICSEGDAPAAHSSCSSPSSTSRSRRRASPRRRSSRSSRRRASAGRRPTRRSCRRSSTRST